MDLFSLFLLTQENNEIKSPTKIYDFTVFGKLLLHRKASYLLFQKFKGSWQFSFAGDS